MNEPAAQPARQPIVRPVDRRTLLRATAWSAPVVAFAVSAPLAAASTPPNGVLISASAPTLASIPSGGGSSPFSLQLTNQGTTTTGPLTVWVSRLTGFAGLSDSLGPAGLGGWTVSEDASNFILLFAAGLAAGQSSDVFSGTWVVTKAIHAAYSGTSSVQLNPKSAGTEDVSLSFATPAAADAISLGEAAAYLILAKSALTVVGTASRLTGGLVGVENGPYTNIPPVAADKGTDAQNAQAKLDTQAAYAAAQSAGPATTVTGGLGGKTLQPGVYSHVDALDLTGVLTLDAAGEPSAVFIIQTGGILSTAAASKVVLANGASASNVFWVAVGAIDLGSDCAFSGTALSGAAITVGEGATVVGRLLTTTSEVTICDITQSMAA